MGKQTLFVATRNRELLALLRLLPGISVRTASGAEELLEEEHLLLDSRAMKRCCLEHLQRCGARPQEPVGPAVTLEAVWPNARRYSGQSLSRRAWIDRRSVLSLQDRPELMRRFLDLACGQRVRGYTVSEAAAELGMSVRHLHRRVLRELRLPPVLVLALARVVSVANDVLTSERSLTSIAREHGYRDLAGMDRQFHKFVGVSPGIYRMNRNAPIVRNSQSDGRKGRLISPPERRT